MLTGENGSPLLFVPIIVNAVLRSLDINAVSVTRVRSPTSVAVTNGDDIGNDCTVAIRVAGGLRPAAVKPSPRESSPPACNRVPAAKSPMFVAVTNGALNGKVSTSDKNTTDGLAPPEFAPVSNVIARATADGVIVGVIVGVNVTVGVIVGVGVTVAVVVGVGVGDN